MKLFGLRIMKEKTYQAMVKKYTDQQRHDTAEIKHLIASNTRLLLAYKRLRGR